MLYGIGLQFTFAICLWILLDLVRARGPRLQRIAFGMLATSCATWALGEMWVQAARSTDMLLYARRLLWFGAALLPPAWLLTAAITARAPWALATPWRAALAALPMVGLCSLLWFDPAGRFTSWTTPRPVHGPLFYVFVALGWIQITAGAFYFLQAAAKLPREQRPRMLAIAAGALLPAVGNLIHLLPQAPSVDLTPVFLGFGGLLIRLAVLDSGLASILPLGRTDVLEQVPTAVLIADLSGRVIDSNRAARELLDDERVEGMPLAELVDRAKRIPERAIEVGRTRIRHAFGDAGEVALLTDRTETASLERQLVQAQKLESLGLLAGGVAHDFNNLLTGILGNTKLALAEAAASPAARECLEEVIQAAELAARLTGQMLAYSGRGRLEVRAIDLREAVRSLRALLQSSIPRNVGFVLDLGEVVPKAEADPAQVQQVVLNLVLNAAEAIGDRRGVVRVRFGARRLGEPQLLGLVAGSGMRPGLHVWLEVADTGSGMDADTMARMFDPFFSTKFTGRGLGLAAVLGIVRGHRGGMEVRSREGDGTLVRVYFPTALAHSEERAPAERVSAPEVRGSVLVVDDEVLVRDLARRTLERAGHRTYVAAGGRDAVEAFRKHRDEIRIVVLDATMPDAAGAETFGELRRIEPRIPILLSSGYPDDASVAAIADDPLAGFLAKPWTPEDLVSSVRERLAAASARETPVS